MGMTTAVSPQRWELARDALRTGSGQLRSLLVSGADPRLMATRHWSVADTAAHVLWIATMYAGMVDGDVAPDPDSMLALTNVDTIADINAHMLRHFAERRPLVLADRLEDAVGLILAGSAQLDPATPIPWLGGSRVPVAGLLAHLVNELLVHGWDIARAQRVDWPMPDEHCALYWDLFFFGMLRLGYGTLLNSAQRMPRRPIAVRFSSAYTPDETVALSEGRARLVPPAAGYDARVTFRPARFNLMLFGRVGTLSAALRRDVVVGGPRPWLLPSFLRVVHMPNNAVPT